MTMSSDKNRQIIEDLLAKSDTPRTSKQYGEVLDLSHRATQLDPNSALAHTSKARALYELKRYEEALASCELALQLDPTLAQAHACKGRILSQLNRLGKALASLDEAIRLDPGESVDWQSNRVGSA